MKTLREYIFVVLIPVCIGIVFEGLSKDDFFGHPISFPTMFLLYYFITHILKKKIKNITILKLILTVIGGIIGVLAFAVPFVIFELFKGVAGYCGYGIVYLISLVGFPLGVIYSLFAYPVKLLKNRDER